MSFASFQTYFPNRQRDIFCISGIFRIYTRIGNKVLWLWTMFCCRGLVCTECPTCGSVMFKGQGCWYSVCFLLSPNSTKKNNKNVLVCLTILSDFSSPFVAPSPLIPTKDIIHKWVTNLQFHFYKRLNNLLKQLDTVFSKQFYSVNCAFPADYFQQRIWHSSAYLQQQDGVCRT